MTENADVEWFRAAANNGTEWVVLGKDEARRLLAHIDQLEADIEDYKKDALRRALCNEPEPDRRPTVHETAAGNMQGIMARGTGGYSSWRDMAVDAYDAAEALVAEGRRRDGKSA